jgi:hypothetical protein
MPEFNNPFEQTDSIQDSIAQQYKDIDIGSTLQNDLQLKKSMINLTNNTKIKLQSYPIKGSTRKKIVITRGRFFKRQKVEFMVQMDQDQYITGLAELEKVFMVFMKNFVNHEKMLSDIGYDIFHKTFDVTNLDALPETMYHIQNVLTKDLPMWTRFKKLFAIIDLTIEPIIVSTVKWKMFNYLLHQRRVTLVDQHDFDGKITMVTPPAEVHKVLDLFVFMPYCYLFFLYKHLNMDRSLDQVILSKIEPINLAGDSSQ